MQIGITGEGPDDYGKFIPGEGLTKGAAEGYAEEIAEQFGCQIEWLFLDRHSVEKVKLGRSSRSLVNKGGKTQNAARFKMLAVLKDCDGAVYYCDSDRSAGAKNSSLHQAQNRYDEIYAEVSAGLRADNTFENGATPAVPMIPMRIIENWLLGDPDNLRRAYQIDDLNEKLGTTDTELLWGDQNNPKSNYPKCIMKRIKDRSREKVRNSLSYYDIALNASSDVLRKNCWYSYGRFFKDFSKMIEEIMEAFR